MTTSAHIALISRQELDKLSKEHHIDLKTGDKLEGKVTNIRNDGKVNVDFGKFQAALELKTPVQKGDVISVVVVEKGKQIKLKVEQIKSEISNEAKKAEVQSQALQSTESKEHKQSIDRMVQEEIKPSNRAEYFKSDSSTRLHQDIKNSLSKLQKILESPQDANIKDIKNLSNEIKSILSNLKSYDDALNIGEKILKPLSQLDAAVRDSGISVGKDVKEVLQKIADAADKIVKLNNIDQLPDIKTIIDKELKPNVARLKEIVQREAPNVENQSRQAAENLKTKVDNLLENLNKTLERLPDKINAKENVELPREVRQALKQVAELKTMAEKSGTHINKEAKEIINKLAETADKIRQMNAPEQLKEARSIIENQLKPDLVRLKEVVDRQVVAREAIRAEQSTPPKTPTEIKADINKTLDQLVKNLDNAVQKTAQSTTSSQTNTPETLESLLKGTGKVDGNIESNVQTQRPVTETASVPRETAQVLKQVVELKTAIENSGLPIDKETREIINRLAETADKISRAETPEQVREIKTITEKQLKPDLLKLKETIDRQINRVDTPKPETKTQSQQQEIADKQTSEQRQAAENIKKAVDILVKNLDKAVEKISSPGQSAESTGAKAATETLESALKSSSQTQTQRTAVDSRPIPGETLELLKQVSELKAMVEKSGIPLDKDTREIINRLAETADKIAQSKNIDPQEIKDITEKQLKPDLEKLKVSIDRQVSRLETAKPEIETTSGKEIKEQPREQTAAQTRQAAEEIKKNVNSLLKNLDNAMEKLVQPSGPASSAEAVTLESLLRTTSEPAISQISPGESSLGATLQMPESTVSSSESGTVPREALEVIKQVTELKALLEKSGITLDKETQEIVDRLTETADKIKELPPTKQAEEIKNIVDNQLKPDLLRLRRALQNQSVTQPSPETPKATPSTGTATETQTPERQSAQELKQAVDNLLQNLEKALDKLPDDIKSSERIETLLKEIKTIRRTLETRTENLDTGNRMVAEVSKLKSMMENAGFPPEKQIEAVMEKLSAAADKISSLKSTEQLPELKTILENEIKPNLAELKDLAAAEAAKPEQTPENRQAMEEIMKRVEHLQKDLHQALEKIPDKEQISQESRDLVKDIENVLNKISDFSHSADKAQFAEDLEALFENIKLALKQLRFNLQTNRNVFNITPEAKEALSNLQLNFSSPKIAEYATQQIEQLKALIDFIQNSELPVTKQMESLMASLSESMNKLMELKNTGQWGKFMQMLQNEVNTGLNQLKDFYSYMQSLPEGDVPSRIHTQSGAVLNAIEQFQTNVEKFIQQGTQAQLNPAELGDLMKKADNLPQEIKNVLSKMPQSLQTPENLSQLSENINTALAKYTPGHPTFEGSNMPSGVKQMLSLLRDHFQPLDISEGALKLTPKLKSLVDDSGIFFEKKIQDTINRITDAASRIAGIENLKQLPEINKIISNDLKPNLAALKEFLNSEQLTAEPGKRDALETVKKAVDDLLTNINNQQNKAVDTQGQQQQPFQVFSFNIPIKNQHDAQLKVFYNKGRQKEDEDDFKLSLLLDMENLGEIRTDFSQFESNLLITFFVKSDEIKDYIDENIHEVREAVKEDFQSLRLKVIVSEERIAEFGEETAHPEIISDKAVDVKV